MSFDEMRELSIAVVGATGCLGRELVAQLSDYVEIRKLHLFATKKRLGDYVEANGQNYSVEYLPEGNFPESVLNDVDVVIFCAPAKVVKEYAPILMDEGIALFDLSGALGSQFGLSLLGVHAGEDNFMEHRVCSLPSATAASLSLLFHALIEEGAWNLQSTVSLSASRFGQGGIEELGAQIRALLSFQDGPQNIFPDGLAFDVMPNVGPVMESGWTGAELHIASEMSTLLNKPEQYFRTTLQIVPIISGIMASCQIGLSNEVTIEKISATLEKHDIFEVLPALSNSRSALGDYHIHLGRLRLNPIHQGIDLQLSTDNVGLAVHNALALLKHFVEQEIL